MELNLTINDLKYSCVVIQVITAVVATLFYPKYKNTQAKYIVVLLWYTALNDIIAGIYSSEVSIYNAPFYNIFQIIFTIYYLSLYKSVVESLKFKKFISYFILIYLFSFIVALFTDDFSKFHLSLSYITGSILIVTSIILYFSEILNSDKIIRINKMLMFWISIALLTCLLPDIPFDVIRRYYEKSPTIPYIYVVTFVLIITFNLILISGFIWSEKQQKQ
jgi:hypothetical protein